MFSFSDTTCYSDGELSLILQENRQANPTLQLLPTQYFLIRREEDNADVGRIDLRIGWTDSTFYSGNVGYTVHLPYRGHRYAAKACRLLAEPARGYGMRTLFLTCAEQNAASRRTCELLGARFLGAVPLPRGNKLYLQGVRTMLRFRLDLSKPFPVL